MKFTLSWLKAHLDTEAEVDQVAEAMTMAGLEVEEVHDPIAALAPFTVAKIVSAERHPNADRLQVCQVETVDGMKEIVCGAPNARAGLTTIYAPIGAYVPGLGVTLVEKPVRGVVSNGMLCSASELELSDESDGILELADDLQVGEPAAGVFGAEPVIDFEVTPNRPDWLGVAGIARDLAAAGLGKLTTPEIVPVAGSFDSPVSVALEATELCPVFAGRVIRGVRNGPSPEWLQQRLTAIGLRPINRLVDITNLISYDRARPLHVYDLATLSGEGIVVRAGRGEADSLVALDGKTYAPGAADCVITDAGGQRAIGLGGVMGGVSTGCSDETVNVFVESAWFDPIATAQTGRSLGINSDAQYRFARGVDTASVVPGLELATQLILDLCGGEPSTVTVAGQAPAAPAAFAFDPDGPIRWIEPRLILSHLVVADTPGHAGNARQRQAFERILAHAPPGVPRSLANSAGCWLGQDYHYDLCRVGAALFGLDASPSAKAMQPVVEVTGRVIQTRAVPAGAGVGYGWAVTAVEGMRLATIGVGYADGWPRQLSAVGGAAFKGRLLPFVGRISMDSLVVDISALSPDALKPGDHVELLGPNRPPEQLALEGATIDYEVIARLGRRLCREYVS